MPVEGVPVAQRFEFGRYRMDCGERQLTRDGDPVHLPPKSFDLLLVLLSSAGHLVQKNELRERVWPDTFVDDVNMAQHISILRKALRDGDNGYRFIETVPRLGYRFTAAVRQSSEQSLSNAEKKHSCLPHVTQAQDPMSPAPKVSAWAKLLAAGTLFVAAVAAFAIAMVLKEHARLHEIKSIAVLPFTNLSGDASQDYFADGMTEELITDVSTLGGVQVISRGSVMRYKDSHRPAAQIGRELKVDAVVEGGVLRAGDRVRVTAQLVRTATEQNIWAEQYERDVHDVMALQDEIASNIAKQINAQVTAAQQEYVKRSPQPSLEAQEAYLKGRYFWNRRTESDYLTAIRWFEEAIGYEPNYAAAYAGLADTYALLGSMPNGEIERKVAMPRAKAAAKKALQLDPSLADAHTSLAFVKMHYEWDWASAEDEFKRAIELNPNYVTAHHWYTYDLVATNRLNEAIAEMQRARVLDPLSPIINTDLAETYLWAHRFDEALAQAQAAVALDPSFLLAHMMLERIYVAKHRFAEAIREGQEAVKLVPGDRWASTRLANALAAAGQKEEARKIQNALELQFVANGDRDDLVLVYAALGDRDRMFAALQTLYAQHDGGLILLNYEEDWDPYRSDPRFKELVRRVGLPPRN